MAQVKVWWLEREHERKIMTKKKSWSRSKSKSRGNNKCFKCNKERHYVKYCPNQKGKEKEKTSNFDDIVVIEENSDIAYVLLVIVNNLGDECIFY